MGLWIALSGFMLILIGMYYVRFSQSLIDMDGKKEAWYAIFRINTYGKLLSTGLILVGMVCMFAGVLG